MRQPIYCTFCAGKLATRFTEGRDRLVCRACGSVHYQNPLPAATALVLNDSGELLLGRRAVEPARGGWCLPGGFVELDESMERASIRELKEETGLTGRIAGFAGCFYQQSRMYGGVIIFGYRVLVIGGEPAAGDDLSEIAYFPLDQLPEVAFEAHRRLIAELKKLRAQGAEA